MGEKLRILIKVQETLYAEQGGRNISFFKEEAIAVEMYEKFRNSGTEDVNSIAKSTGFSVTRVKEIKDHVFDQVVKRKLKVENLKTVKLKEHILIINEFMGPIE